jgi:hypothetical protein
MRRCLSLFRVRRESGDSRNADRIETEREGLALDGLGE